MARLAGLGLSVWPGTRGPFDASGRIESPSTEEMADRIGVINKGEIIVVEDKVVLMKKLGKKQLMLHLQNPLDKIPEELTSYSLELMAEGNELIYTFDTQQDQTGIAGLLRRLNEHGIDFKDLHSSESSLEEIFVSLVRAK